MSVTAVSTLVSSIKTRIATVASGYSELGYAKDVTKNTFSGNMKRYGVLPGSSSETSGINRALTMDQTFEIVLTDGFINKQMSDSEEQSKVITLQDLMKDIYLDLVNTKAGSPSTCMIVSQLQLQNPETIKEQNVVIQRATINVKYRINL